MKDMQEYSSDFLYYKKWDFEDLFTSERYNALSGYIILKPWPAGFNNVRMSFESAVCIAYISNRILVLPPKITMCMIPGRGDAQLENFFDINDIGIKVLSFKEFCNIHNIPESYDAVESISAVDTTPDYHVLNFTDEDPPNKFLKDREFTNMKELFNSNKNVFFNGTLFGNFYLKIYSNINTELCKLIARHVHYTPWLLNVAQNAINFLGDKNYYAIHIRRTDFEIVRKHITLTAVEILNNIKDIIPEGSRLYIATDHKDMEFFTPFKEKYELFFYKDIEHVLNAEIHNNYTGLIEQLICTRAMKFVGNELSTLSTYIYRLRGYMSDIEDKNYYINTSQFRQDEQCNFTDTSHHRNNWAREFKDAWKF